MNEPMQQGLGAVAGAPATEQGPEASPEEQALYDDVVARAYKLIFDLDKQEVRPSVIEALQDEADPKAALGQTAAAIFHRVEQAAADAGQAISGEMKEAAGSEVYAKLAEIATAIGTHDFMGDDDAFHGAFYIAADELRRMEEASGMIDPEQARSEFAEIAQAEKDGTLDAILRGVA